MAMTDATDAYFNSGTRIQFTHVPSDKTVAFKAFIADFTDSYTSNWNEEAVFGRMDPLATFQNTERKISLSWAVVAKDEQEASKNLKNLDLLLAMQYPVYESTSASSIIAPPLFKVRFANLIQESGRSMVCAISGFEFSPDMEAGFFSGGLGKIYPKLINMSCQITVLHTRDVGWNPSGNWRGSTGAHTSVPISALAGMASGEVGEKKQEEEATEANAQNPDETPSLADCQMLTSVVERADCQALVSEAALARHAEHEAEMEEAGFVSGERIREMRQDNRQFFSDERTRLRAEDQAAGQPRRTNRQLNNQIAEEQGWSNDDMRYAGIGGHVPFRPAGGGTGS
jgi:hypothetical protein